MHPEGLHGLDEVNVVIAVELSKVRDLIRIMVILVILYDPVSTWKRGKSFVPVKLFPAVREREDNCTLIFD